MKFNRVDVWEAEEPYTYRIERSEDTYTVKTWSEGGIECREGWIDEGTHPTMYAAMEWCRQDKREKEEWEAGREERAQKWRERLATLDARIAAGEKLTLEDYEYSVLRHAHYPHTPFLQAIAKKPAPTEWGLADKEEDQ